MPKLTSTIRPLCSLSYVCCFSQEGLPVAPRFPASLSAFTSPKQSSKDRKQSSSNCLCPGLQDHCPVKSPNFLSRPSGLFSLAPSLSCMHLDVSDGMCHSSLSLHLGSLVPSRISDFPSSDQYPGHLPCTHTGIMRTF